MCPQRPALFVFDLQTTTPIDEFRSAFIRFEQDFDRSDQLGSIDMTQWVRKNISPLLHTLREHPQYENLRLAALSARPGEVFRIAHHILQ